MTNQEILSHIDHTLLKAVASWEDIKKLCDESLAYKTASVCIPPSYIRRVYEAYHAKGITIGTVVGFPLGYSVTPVKIREAEEAVAQGASEIDMVLNIGDIKNRDFDKVHEEIASLKQGVGAKILKVIIETCYLTEAEKIRLCEIVTAAKADYIKTSTGFGTGGAMLEDILLFKNHIGSQVKIKAAGGVKTREDLEVFLSAGCDRIGTSSAVALLTGGCGAGAC
ncbi:MAG: deoxyribose-phosphate aldolase [Treponema sp.]|jgi:deoxyribose-phosphate aldolase|nr:deoxyribose-phosphate aldolase [Treponema sp.]